MFISEIRNFDLESHRNGWGATSSKGTIHVTAADMSSTTPVPPGTADGPSRVGCGISGVGPVRSTCSRAVASTMQFHENLFFPLSANQDLPLRIELCTDEFGCREISFASANVVFRGEKYEGTLQMRDANNDVMATATVFIRYAYTLIMSLVSLGWC